MQAKVIALEQYEAHQMSLKLFFADKAPVIKHPATRKPVADVPKVQEWTDDDISCLREAILMDTLRHLTDGRSSTAKKDALDWMLDDEIHPFSFRVCVAEMGMDYEEIRTRVLRMIASLEQKTANWQSRQKEKAND